MPVSDFFSGLLHFRRGTGHSNRIKFGIIHFSRWLQPKWRQGNDIDGKWLLRIQNNSYPVTRLGLNCIVLFFFDIPAVRDELTVTSVSIVFFLSFFSYYVIYHFILLQLV